MGKRSAFERNERDFYPTPVAAIRPLLPHLKPNSRFCEPMAGNGVMLDYLVNAGHICTAAWDIESQREDIDKHDALTRLCGNIDYFITNPPWDRKVLHAAILHFSVQSPTWLLFDADWPHTTQSIPFLPLLRKMVSVGRVKWIEDSPFTGKDNCAWYLFAPGDSPIEFVGRAEPDFSFSLDDI